MAEFRAEFLTSLNGINTDFSCIPCTMYLLKSKFEISKVCLPDGHPFEKAWLLPGVCVCVCAWSC